MSSPADSPGDRGTPATAPSAAELISALTLPTIDPLGTELPPVEYVAAVMQAGLDQTITALAAIKHLEDATAACKAALLERLVSLSTLEARALDLDPWQDSIASLTLRSEVACVFHIPEGTAGKLLEHSTALVRDHPGTWAALNAGTLSWRHAGIILEEIATLENTPGMLGPDINAFETHLLTKAPTTTAARFQGTARRLRERTHPETITTRTRAAYLDRAMRLEPRTDGMAVLTLHLPAPTAQGIWNHCTRLARTLQTHHHAPTLNQPTESRTLTQLRIDVAATLLLTQPGTTNSPDGHDTKTGTGAGIGTDPAAGTGTGTETGTGTAGGLAGSLAGGSDDGSDGGREARRLSSGARAARFWAGVDLDGENALEDQLQIQDDLVTGRYVTEPPLPRAQILVTVPLLGLLGLTTEPAELEGHGPISTEVARRLLIDASSFLRVLTDPVTGKTLATSPDTYRVSKKMRLTLQARDKNCQFPGCPRHVFDTDLDHLIAWDHGGTSTEDNLEHLCRKHHLIKHFKDNKDRTGKTRPPKNHRLAGTKLRGWTPHTTPDGTIGWTSPTGRYYPPPPRETPPPAYPGWLKKRLQQTPNNPTTSKKPATPRPTTP